MKNFPVILFLCSCLMVKAADNAPADISADLEPFRAQGKIPGIAALVLRGDRIIAQGAAGVRKQGAPDRITLDDQFHLGSCTKAMTATLAAMLVEEGKLKWTTTLDELFGDTVKDMNPAWKSVTLQQVLAHRSGLRDPGLFGLLLFKRQSRSSKNSLPEQRQQVVTRALKRAPASKPGEKFVYCNVGYIIVGAALEKITGRSWEDLMRERLFKPLGITTGGFGAPGAAGKVDQPWGHTGSGRPVDPGSREADNPAVVGPAGTARMTLADWAKFITLHLRGDPANPNLQAALLKPETFAELHHAAAGQEYNAGWRIGNAKRANGGRPGDTGRVLEQEGSNDLWCCIVWTAPEIDFAVLVACNRDDENGVEEVVGHAVSELVRKFAAKPRSDSTQP